MVERYELVVNNIAKRNNVNLDFLNEDVAKKGY